MIKFKALSRKNPITKSTKFYPASTTPTVMNLDAVNAEIEKITSLSSGDVKNCLDTLQFVLIRALLEGKTVHLGDVGCFRTSINGKGVDKAEDVTADHILRVAIIFTASSKIKRKFSLKSGEVKFEKITKK